MNKPPPPELEVLEELDDEAIVAQQARAHSPAPRAHVVEEERTIMVSEPAASDAGDTTRLRRLDPSRHDPTLVLRAVRPSDLRIPPPPGSAPTRPGMPAWALWVIWAILGLIAFGVGGFIAVRANQPSPAAVPTAPRR